MGDNVTNNQASIILPMQMLVMTCTNPIGAYLQKRVDPKVLLNVGFLLVFGSVYIATNIAYKWSTFVFFFGILQAIGYGLLFWTPILCSWEWFGKGDRGKATGVILAGFGVSPFIFGIITTAIVNPDNVKRVKDIGSGHSFFPESVSSKIPEMYRICLCIWAVLAVISLSTVRRNPEVVSQEEKRR
jgi:MFS family permease